VISWLPHGRAFRVLNPKLLVKELLPVYFNQSRYSSFQRQLHMYNFQRITQGLDKGAYHHPYFLRGEPNLCMKMHRTRINGKGTRKPANPEVEPNLLAMTPLPRIPLGTNIEIPLILSSFECVDDDHDDHDDEAKISTVTTYSECSNNGIVNSPVVDNDGVLYDNEHANNRQAALAAMMELATMNSSVVENIGNLRFG
jgi:hypothetical protein